MEPDLLMKQSLGIPKVLEENVVKPEIWCEWVGAKATAVWMTWLPRAG